MPQYSSFTTHQEAFNHKDSHLSFGLLLYYSTYPYSTLIVVNSHFLKQKSHSARITRQETIHIIIVYGTNQDTKPYYINITLITHNPDSSEQSLI